MQNASKKLGILYIVATPIGNLKDITLRALDILATVDLIAVEDTRHSKKLLQHYQISTPLLSLHQTNEKARLDQIIQRLHSGQHIALISDAGTPLISDPGYALICAARAAGIDVSPIPGPCALVAALSVAGLPADSFAFEGFLPAKSSARQQKLRELSNDARTVIFYEAPHRIMQTLADMIEVFGPERQISINRELTKMFESIQTGTVASLYEFLQSHPEQQQGEFVILVKGVDTPQTEDSAVRSILNILLQELSLKQAVQLTAKITAVNKNHVYQLALAEKQ